MSDDQTPTRKASEVLLDLENDIKTLLSIVKSQELNIRVLSNKLNTVMEKLDKQPVVNATPTFRVEAVGAKVPTPPVPPPSFTPPIMEDKQIPFFSEHKLPITDEPEGFRRTSRPETYSGDNAYLVKPNTPMEAIKFPPQNNAPKPPPGRTPSEVIVPPKANKIEVPPTPPATPITVQPPMNQNAVPVQQRVVNKESKSVFLADVEIIDHQTAQPVFKTRTSGAGKWMASLAPGNYRVTINKRESMTKQKVEVVQDIQVDGTKSPLELQTIIIK